MVKMEWGISIVNWRGVWGISLGRNANKKCQQDNLLPTERGNPLAEKEEGNKGRQEKKEKWKWKRTIVGRPKFKISDFTSNFKMENLDKSKYVKIL